MELLAGLALPALPDVAWNWLKEPDGAASFLLPKKPMILVL